MIKVVFYLFGTSFSYRFLADWTKLLQTCLDYGVGWKTVFTADFDNLRQVLKQGKIKYDYLMLIDSESIFEPEQFKKLLEKMEKHPKIDILSAKSLKKDSTNFGFTLIRKGVLENLSEKTGLHPLVDPQVVIGYEKIVIWR